MKRDALAQNPPPPRLPRSFAFAALFSSVQENLPVERVGGGGGGGGRGRALFSPLVLVSSALPYPAYGALFCLRDPPRGEGGNPLPSPSRALARGAREKKMVDRNKPGKAILFRISGVRRMELPMPAARDRVIYSCNNYIGREIKLMPRYLSIIGVGASLEFYSSVQKIVLSEPRSSVARVARLWITT